MEQPNERERLDDREHAELLMLYGIAVDDVDRSKREQWTHFYAIILALAAVAGFAHSAGIMQHSLPGQWVCLTVALLASVAVLVILLHQVRLSQQRALIEGYSKKLEEHIQKLREMKVGQRPLHQLFSAQPSWSS